ncbi:aminoglycoside phosphotransferase [Streptomyces hygroscopicus]|nr:aminoglycoside phosphotransferase [Streptomyces hygroscopicus]
MNVGMTASTSGPWSGTLAATARSAAAAVRPVAVQATRYGRTCPGAASGIPYSSEPRRNDASAQPRPTPRMVTPAAHKAWRHSGPGRRDSSSLSELAQLSGLERPGDSVTPRKRSPNAAGSHPNRRPMLSRRPRSSAELSVLSPSLVSSPHPPHFVGSPEVVAMALAPVPTPEVMWRKPPVLAIAAVPGTALGRLGKPSTASPAAWATAGAAIRKLHDAPLPPWPGRSLDELAADLEGECEWLVTNGVLPADLVTRNRPGRRGRAPAVDSGVHARRPEDHSRVHRRGRDHWHHRLVREGPG